MTNGEKLIEIFPNNAHTTLKRTTQFAINPMTINQQMIVVDNDFWNDEYKEPIAKNDLGVDCISRQDVLSEIIRFSTEEGSSVECQQLYCDVNNMPSVTPQESALNKIRAEIKEWYWQADKQKLAEDPCVVDAMIDLFIRTIDKYK